jgi:thioredoxin reductase (NADPH)
VGPRSLTVEVEVTVSDPPRWPVLLVVDDDREDLARSTAELRRRFGADYDIVARTSAEEGTAVLERLAREGTDVALVLADHRLPGLSGTDLLARVHGLHPGARRALLIRWGEWADQAVAGRVLDAMALGWVDYYVLKPWRSPDELFARTVSEFVHEWSRGHSRGGGPITLVVERWSPRSSAVRGLLSRNGVPHVVHDAATPAGRAILAGIPAGAQLPVIVGLDGVARSNPSDVEVARACGLPTELTDRDVDVLIVGAGPGGLAAAVYASSEGLSTLVVERETIGGQAASSSLIRNYLGFPRGITGAELTMRAYQQAWVFGARFLLMGEVRSLARDGDRLVAEVSGESVRARAVVVATGVSYRRLGVPELESLQGAGVFYGASIAEAQALRGQRAVVVGGGNSAGQAAMHLARYAAHVTLVVRGDTLRSSMSRYLIDEIGSAANIEVALRTEVVGGGGQGHLETVTLRDRDSAPTHADPVAGMFVMVGATPHTDWLPEAVSRDDWGFVPTGPDAAGPGWPLQRAPAPLETTMPGVFAVGDVRQKAPKRVAAAVGDGSVVITQVLDHLAAGA